MLYYEGSTIASHRPPSIDPGLELIDEGVVIIYMDDILIFGRTEEQHCSVVLWVLDILWIHHLYLKAEKCTFRQLTVDYFSLILSEGHIEMDLVKVAGIQEWRIPRNVTEVQSFVGFVNLYQCFIQDFLHITKPLHQLTRKGEVWQWTKD